MSTFITDTNNLTTTSVLSLEKPQEEDSIISNSDFYNYLKDTINETRRLYFVFSSEDDDSEPPLPPKLRRDPNTLTLNDACKNVNPGDWKCVMDKNLNEKAYIYMDERKSYWYIITSDEEVLSDREIIFVDFYYYNQNNLVLPQEIENILEILKTYTDIYFSYLCKYDLPEYQMILSAVLEYSKNPFNQKYDSMKLTEYLSTFDKTTNITFFTIMNNNPWIIIFERIMNNKCYFVVKSDKDIVYLVETLLDMSEISNLIVLP